MSGVLNRYIVIDKQSGYTYGITLTRSLGRERVFGDGKRIVTESIKDETNVVNSG